MGKDSSSMRFLQFRTFGLWIFCVVKVSGVFCIKENSDPCNLDKPINIYKCKI